MLPETLVDISDADTYTNAVADCNADSGSDRKPDTGARTDADGKPVAGNDKGLHTGPLAQRVHVGDRTDPAPDGERVRMKLRAGTGEVAQGVGIIGTVTIDSFSGGGVRRGPASRRSRRSRVVRFSPSTYSIA